MSPSDSFWAGRSVFVTGASGLLGGWLVRELFERGAAVTALVRDEGPKSMLFRDGWSERITLVRGEVGDGATLRRVLCEYQVDTAFHLAAQALVEVAKIDPVGTLEANVRGTWNLLEAARQAGTRQVIVASSDKAYGASTSLPYRETHPLQGQFPYNVSKSCADLICGMYASTYALPVCVTRCGNLFGGGDLNFSRTVPGVIRATLRGERFSIRSDGRFVRDFLYVRDGVLAYLTLAERLAADRSLAGEAFNFSLELRLTVLDMVHKVLQRMERTDLEPVIHNAASSEIREQYLSAEKARQVLGWTPRFGLDDGLAETIDWYRAFLTEDGRSGPPAIAAP